VVLQAQLDIRLQQHGPAPGAAMKLTLLLS
ncbi:MAG: hypothetical protein JWR60_1428, partial [Polaromonas sp.]|nr:hypothetical protein [Polaromonas sp.]